MNTPIAADIAGKRKLYVTLMVPLSPGAPEGFDERYNAYWKAADKNISQLESRAGLVKRIFVEGVARGGQAGLNMLERSNPAAYEIVATRVKSGATLEAFEDELLFAEVLDWGRCLQVGFASRKAAQTVSDAFKKATEERLKSLQMKLNDGLKLMEAGLLLATRFDSVMPPADVERFMVSPPELDELDRWVRQANEAIMKAMEEEEAQMMREQGAPDPHAGHAHGPVATGMGHGPARQQAPRQGPPPPPQQRAGGLWTPGQQR